MGVSHPRPPGRRRRSHPRLHSGGGRGASRPRAPGRPEASSAVFRGTDRVERWYETTHAPVVDERGMVIGVCLNARDVSERKRGEQALRESEARYRDLFDNASDLVCTTSLEGDFPLRQPRLARGHRVSGRRAGAAPLPGPGAPGQPGPVSGRRGPGPGRGNAGPRGARAGQRRPGRAADARGQHQLHHHRRRAGAAPRHLPRRQRAKRVEERLRAGPADEAGGGWPAAWRTRSTT